MSAAVSASPGRHAARGATCRIVAVVALAQLVACGDSDQSRDDEVVLDPATATLVYRFNDASVPPEYHRSYTLTADAASANLIVDSYGDVLHDVTEQIEDDVWQRTLDAAAALSNVTDVTSEGCAGGTSEEIRVLDDDDQALIDVEVDHCGASAGPPLAEAVGDVLALFDLDQLLAPG